MVLQMDDEDTMKHVSNKEVCKKMGKMGRRGGDYPCQKETLSVSRTHNWEKVLREFNGHKMYQECRDN